jgi:hypothetical protein
MLTFLIVNGSSAPSSVPSGWTLSEQYFQSGSVCVYVYEKIAGGSEPSSYTWTWAGTIIVAGGMAAAYSDASLPLKVDDHHSQNNTASSANREWPSLTTSQPDSYLFFFGYVGSSASTPDAACTERWDTGLTLRTYLMTEARSAVGVTGTRTATGVATSCKVISIAVSENPPGGSIVAILEDATLSSAAQVDGVLYRGKSTPNSGSNPSTLTLTQDIPGLADGDYMLMAIYANSNEATPPQPPGGWTLLESEASGSYFVEVWGKIASSEPSNYTITKNTGTKVYGGIILAFHSASAKTLYADVRAHQINASSTNYTAPGVTTTKTSAGLACFLASSTSFGITPAAGMTERLDSLFNSGVHAYAMTSILTSSGATGDKVATGTAAASRAVTVAIAEVEGTEGTLAVTLEDATLSSTAETSDVGTLAATLADATLAAAATVIDPHHIVIRDTVLVPSATGNSLVFALPAGVQPHDLLLLWIGLTTVVQLSSLTLAGWTFEGGGQVGTGGAFVSGYLFSKRAEAGEADPVTVFFDATYTATGVITALYSTVATMPHLYSKIPGSSDAHTTNLAWNIVFSPDADSLLLYFGVTTGSGDITPSVETTELWDFGTPHIYGATDREDAGMVSARTATIASGASYLGWSTSYNEILLPVEGALAVTLADATLSSSASNLGEITADLAVTLEDAALAASSVALSPIAADLAVTLQDATLAASAYPAVTGTLAVTLEDARLSSVAHTPSGYEASRVRAVHLYMHKPVPIFQARVNLPTPVYPLNALPYDGVTLGAYTDIGPYMFFTVGSTALGDDKGRGRVRYLASSTEISLPYTSIGTRDGELDLADNDHVTVWDDHRIHSKRPWIAPDGELFKDSNIEVEALITRWSFPGGVPTSTDVLGNYNELLTPVANTGPAFADYIDPDTGLITVDFPGTGNFSFATADGATIIHYQWDVKDGTITVGTATSATITATFPAGFRWVALTVVDSNGIPHSAWTQVLAVDPDADVTLKEFTDLTLSRAVDGQELSFKLLKDLSRADYPDGTFVMLWYDEPTSPGDRSHMQFVGRHISEASSINAQETATLRDTTIKCLDAAGQLKKLAGLPQTISDEILRDEELEPATTWSYMPSPNIDKLFHSLLSYQATLLDTTDVYMSGTGADYPFVEKQAGGDDLWGQIAKLPATLVPDYVLTCNIQGQFKVVLDPMLIDVGDRPSDVLITIEEDSFAQVSWNYERAPKIYALWGDAQLTATNYVTVDDDEVISAVKSLAPGKAYGQGPSETTWMQQLAQSQADLNKVTGHRYARLNARYGDIPISLPGYNPRYLDVAKLQWAVINLTAETAAQRGFETPSVRGLIKSATITHNFEDEGMTIDVTLSVELETSGKPAVTWVVGEGVPV